MESFVKWGTEKRKLHEIIDPLTAVGAGVIVGGAVYLWTKGQNRKDSKSNFWVRKIFDGPTMKEMYEKGSITNDDWIYIPEKKDWAKIGESKKEDKLPWEIKPEGKFQTKKAFDGLTIVKMYDENFLKKDDLFYPPGAQNWMKIDPKISKKFLPWESSKTHGNGGTKVDDKTKWVAFIKGKRVAYEGSKAFARAIANREVKKGTWVWHSGYGQKWKEYGSKDVDDDIADYVAKETPSVGNTELIGVKNSWYMKNGQRYGPINFEDLLDAGLQPDSSVWIKGFSKGWVKFKDIEDELPSVGQAHASNPRGMLGKLGKYIAGNNVMGQQKTPYQEPDKDAWKKGKTNI